MDGTVGCPPKERLNRVVVSALEGGLLGSDNRAEAKNDFVEGVEEAEKVQDKCSLIHRL